jgi:heavy metal-binding protein
MKKISAFAALMLIASCANGYRNPSLSVDHPANPEAMTAPEGKPSRTLDLASVELPSAERGAEMPGMQGHGESHDHHHAPARNAEHNNAASKEDTSPPSPHEAHQSQENHAGHTEAGANPMSAAHKGAYECPMHPEVTSDDPDARCPKCGMKLVRKKGGEK